MKTAFRIAIALLLCAAIWKLSRLPQERDALPSSLERPASAIEVAPRPSARIAPAAPAASAARSGGGSLVAFDLEQAQAVPEGAVADLLAALLPRAERGDVEAMRQLYLLLQRCREWPMPSTAGPMFVDPAHLARTGMSEVQAREATESALAQAWTQQVEECRDVSAAQVATAGAWLQRAAQAGDPYAQLAYVDAVDEIVGDQRQMLAHPEVVQQFRSDAINYLQGLASRGMPDAMLRLSAAYASGVLTNRDMALAYGYGKAADQLIGGPEDVSLQEYRRSLSGEQLDRAQVLVRSLLATSR